MQTARLYFSHPSNDTGPSLIRALVRAEEKSTQFPDILEDILQKGSHRILFARLPERHEQPLFQRLDHLHRAIQRARRKLEETDANIWNVSIGSSLREHWQDQRARDRTDLVSLQDSFWDLNLADPLERARARLADELGYERWKLKRLANTEAAGATSRVQAPEIVPVPKVTYFPHPRDCRRPVF